MDSLEYLEGMEEVHGGVPMEKVYIYIPVKFLLKDVFGLCWKLDCTLVHSIELEAVRRYNKVEKRDHS
ncbi:hypothetical protein MATL_G00130340 [Megalops atlanticus]|uniref:Uncharacterized protein n=1 Tax=Megalops atlanticus TaxID=7932 RepID=A0A9D3TAF1_MEGAT|nr:hypothetical protein MATL_G00130340 [Megalops atlanticus]